MEYLYTPRYCYISPLCFTAQRRTQVHDRTGAFYPLRSLWAGASIPMRQPPTGEPCAGKPPARFGGRGKDSFVPTPIIAQGKPSGLPLETIQYGCALKVALECGNAKE